MKKGILLTALLVLGNLCAQQGEILFFQTNWGNQLSWEDFCKKAKDSGFDGIDIWLPSNKEDQKQLRAALARHGLKINLMHGTDKSLTFEESLAKYKAHFSQLAQWKPILINSQTGSDFFTKEENMAFILAATAFSKKSGIPVLHETHRGRFSYTLPATMDYLNSDSSLRLTADISHWMVVHESLLQKQDELLKSVINRSDHIHARVGHAEGPQINDPNAPEWQEAVERHMGLWEAIIKRFWSENQRPMTVTTEFGPPPYLPQLPFTQVPVANQWLVNVSIMNLLKKRLGTD